jgi:hypothetical protein
VRRALVALLCAALLPGQSVIKRGPLAAAGGGGGGPITLVSSTNCHAADTGVGGTTFNCTIPSTTTGNLLIAVAYTYNTSIAWSDNKSGGSSTYSTPAGLTDGCKANGTWRVCPAYTANSASGITQVTVTLGANSYLIVHVYEFSGVATSTPLDQSTTATSAGSQSSATVGPVTTTADDELLFVSTTVGLNTSTWTPGSDGGSGTYTAGQIQSTFATSTVVGGDMYLIQSGKTAGSYSGTMDFSPSIADTAQVMMTFKRP